jgi:uncharacterized protein (TIGR03437 family)
MSRSANLSFGFVVICGLAAASRGWAQPTIYPRGVLNAASSAPNGLPNGSIAQGSLFTIYGANLGPTSPAQASSFPLGTTFNNVSITIGQGTAAAKVIPYYVSSGQVNAIMPSNAPLGLQPLYVTFNGTISKPSPVKVVATSFNFFSFNGAGSGTGAIVNYNTSGGTALNSPQATAMPGQIVVAYGTGLGPIATSDTQPAPGNSPTTPIQVFVGGVVASVAYSGRAPGTSGEDQINFTVPANAPTGCWVPVYAVANGITSNAITMSIDTKGAPCSDVANPLSQAFIAGKKLGVIQLLHTDTLQDRAVASAVTIQTDLLTADFGLTGPTTWPFATLFSQPPPGACTLIEHAGDVFGNDASGVPNPETSLGVPVSFTVASTSDSKQVSPAPGSAAAAYLIGSGVPGVSAFPNQVFLSPGTYTVSAAGAGSVGAVQASITLPAAITWTNRSNLQTVPRSTPLSLSWSGLAANQYMAIFGGSVDLPTNSSAMFYCLAPAGASSFVVPAQVLAAVPATRGNYKSKSAIYLWTTAIANGTPFSVPGLDSAYGIGAYVLGKTVVFQ